MITRSTEMDAYKMYDLLKGQDSLLEYDAYCFYVLIEKYISSHTSNIRRNNIIPYIKSSFNVLRNTLSLKLYGELKYFNNIITTFNAIAIDMVDYKNFSEVIK